MANIVDFAVVIITTADGAATLNSSNGDLAGDLAVFASGASIASSVASFTPLGAFISAPAAFVATAFKVAIDIDDGRGIAPGDVFSLAGSAIGFVGASVAITAGAPISLTVAALGLALASAGAVANAIDASGGFGAFVNDVSTAISSLTGGPSGGGGGGGGGGGVGGEPSQYDPTGVIYSGGYNPEGVWEHHWYDDGNGSTTDPFADWDIPAYEVQVSEERYFFNGQPHMRWKYDIYNAHDYKIGEREYSTEEQQALRAPRVEISGNADISVTSASNMDAGKERTDSSRSEFESLNLDQAKYVQDVRPNSSVAVLNTADSLISAMASFTAGGDAALSGDQLASMAMVRPADLYASIV
ncbi:hypothetical protein ACG04R_25475 [Roseateles sp. BYS78W]|uniref:Uncharacterized protein n=1 Tax=Pelomonas candidula TaxID=3299025 RepID=A0ABW7HK51_9BURK